MNELKRFVFSGLTLFFICIFFLTPSAWAQTDGKWSGNTSEGGIVRFTVSGNNVQDFSIEICVSGGSGGFGCFEEVLLFSIPISGSNFSYSNFQFELTGTFTSSNTCTGTWAFHDGILGYGSGTWSASFPASPFIGLYPDQFFGDQDINTTSSAVVTLKNTGGGSATGSVSLTGTNADQFEITSGGGSFSLSPDQSKDIYVQFTPTSTGWKTATLMADGDSPSNDASAHLQGVGKDPMSLSVTPNYHIVSSGAGSATFTVTNEGDYTMSWTAARDPASTWITITSGSSGTNSGTITFSYEANDGDARIGSITVTADGAANSPQTVELRQAEGTPDIILSPSSYDFGDQMAGIATGTVTFTLTNTEGGTATGSVSLAGTDADQFEITGGGGSFSLSYDQSKDISVRFVPTSAGLKTATLMADGDSPSNDTGASLEGTGTRLKLKITASDGASSDYFGTAVSISGDYAIVGADGDDDNGDNSGSAYIFGRTESGWIQLAKLTASDGASSDYFGKAVGISGDYAIVGAYWDDDKGDYSGSAYIFEKPVGGWVDMTETKKLPAIDGAASDYFGTAVSISGDYAIVGADGDDDGGSSSGSAYILERAEHGWVVRTKLRARDGASNDHFGAAVSISGDYAIVGAYMDGNYSGSAYIFERTESGWIQLAKLTATSGATFDFFGEAVGICISGDYAIVGASGTWSGSAYIFEKPVGGWVDMTQTVLLSASDRNENAQFGEAVGISGNYAIVGAYEPGAGGYSGAYIFRRPVDGWINMTETRRFSASSDNFGTEVSISGDYAIVGADGDDDNGDNSGSAYVYFIGNYLPTISHINDQIIIENTSNNVINFFISDSETFPEDLILTGESSNTTLVPNENIVFGGTGVNRTIIITPAPNGTGTTTITVTLNDGIDTVSDSFLLTVIVAPDTDDDGLPDSLENIHCTDFNDADTDDDGIAQRCRYR